MTLHRPGRAKPGAACLTSRNYRKLISGAEAATYLQQVFLLLQGQARRAWLPQWRDCRKVRSGHRCQSDNIIKACTLLPICTSAARPKSRMLV